MKVLINYGGEDFPVDNVSKAMKVKKFKQLIEEVTSVKTDFQCLMFNGKVLNNEDDLCDYRVENNFKIMMLRREPLAPIMDKNTDSETVEENSEEATTASDEDLSEKQRRDELRKIGGEDLVNQLDQEQNEADQEPCKKCKSNEKKKCTECGCNKCGGKTPDDRLLFCEECQYFYHFECIENPIESIDELPEGDWYCDDCRNDPNQIVRPGERMKYGSKRSKMPSRMKEVKRDWGKGFATAGRTKTCTIVDKHHFGPIPGIEVGMSWQYRIQASEVGIHRPPVGGIAGSGESGCQSIVLAGGYEDDEDWGEGFYYTGSGGRDLSGNKRVAAQSCHQELTRQNKAIAVNCNAKFNDKEGATAKDWKAGKPIRVCRSAKFSVHSKYAPSFGVRYDGIYKVVKYWPHKGKSGYIVWRYEFRRDDESPAPWEENAKKYSCVMKVEADAFENSKAKRNIKKSANEPEELSQPTAIQEAYEVEKHILDLIKKDLVYESKWQSLAINEENLRKDQWVEKVQEEFQCYGCSDPVYQPILIPCQHIVCQACLEKSIKENYKHCWVCRKDFDEDFDIANHYHEPLQNIMSIIFPGYENSRVKGKSKPKRAIDSDEANENIKEEPAAKKRKCRAKPKRFKTAEELQDSE